MTKPSPFWRWVLSPVAPAVAGNPEGAGDAAAPDLAVLDGESLGWRRDFWGPSEALAAGTGGIHPAQMWLRASERVGRGMISPGFLPLLLEDLMPIVASHGAHPSPWRGMDASSQG